TFVRSQGGIAGLRTQFRKDNLRIAPILANCAMAGSLSWRQVPSLPFGRAFLSPYWSMWLRFASQPITSPEALAGGLAKFHHDPPNSPLPRLARRQTAGSALALLNQMQLKNGSFVDSIPRTGFVVMSLASMGHAHWPIVRRGVEFLYESLRPDGSWPIAVFP